MKKKFLFWLPLVLGCLTGCNDNASTDIAKITYDNIEDNKVFTYIFDFTQNTFTKVRYANKARDNISGSVCKTFTDEEEKSFLESVSSCKFSSLDNSYGDANVDIKSKLTIEYNNETLNSIEIHSQNNSELASDVNKVFKKLGQSAKELIGESVFYNDLNDNTKDMILPDFEISYYNTTKTEKGNVYLPIMSANYKINSKTKDDVLLYEINFQHSFNYLLDSFSYDLRFVSELRLKNRPNISEIKVIEYPFKLNLGEGNVVFTRSIADANYLATEDYQKLFLVNQSFKLNLNKIYLIECSFADGDYYQYTFNTKLTCMDIAYGAYVSSTNPDFGKLVIKKNNIYELTLNKSIFGSEKNQDVFITGSYLTSISLNDGLASIFLRGTDGKQIEYKIIYDTLILNYSYTNYRIDESPYENLLGSQKLLFVNDKLL